MCCNLFPLACNELMQVSQHVCALHLPSQADHQCLTSGSCRWPMGDVLRTRCSLSLCLDRLCFVAVPCSRGRYMLRPDQSLVTHTLASCSLYGSGTGMVTDYPECRAQSCLCATAMHYLGLGPRQQCLYLVWLMISCITVGMRSGMRALQMNGVSKSCWPVVKVCTISCRSGVSGSFHAKPELHCTYQLVDIMAMLLPVCIGCAMNTFGTWKKLEIACVSSCLQIMLHAQEADEHDSRSHGLRQNLLQATEPF